MKTQVIQKLREQLSKNKYKCREGCYECCTNVPVLEQEVKEMEKELRRLGYSEPPNGKGDKYCEMLTSEGKCSIYNHRPTICRAFSNIKYRLMGTEKLTPSCTYGDGRIQDATPEYIKYGVAILKD